MYIALQKIVSCDEYITSEIIKKQKPHRIGVIILIL